MPGIPTPLSSTKPARTRTRGSGRNHRAKCQDSGRRLRRQVLSGQPVSQLGRLDSRAATRSARAAVSARRRCGPRSTARRPGSEPQAASSSGVKPPGGPETRSQSPCGGRGCASGSAPPGRPSQAPTKLSRAARSQAASPAAGSRSAQAPSDCLRAARASRSQRARRPGSAGPSGQNAQAPSSTAFSTSQSARLPLASAHSHRRSPGGATRTRFTTRPTTPLRSIDSATTSATVPSPSVATNVSPGRSRRLFTRWRASSEATGSASAARLATTTWVMGCPKGWAKRGDDVGLSPERVLDLVEQRLAGLGHAGLVGQAAELLEELLAAGRQLGRRPHREMGVEVSLAATAEARQTEAGEADRLAALRAGRNVVALGLLLAEQGHVERAAERGLAHRQRHVDVEVVAVALEDVVFLLLDVDLEVAGRPAVGPGVAEPAQRNVVALGDAGGDVHGDRRDVDDAAVAAALEARLLDDRAGALALGARPDVDELAEQRRAHLAHAALAAAGGARRLAALLGATALAGLAGHLALHLDRLLDAGGDLLERQLEPHAQVVAATHRPFAPAAAAEQVLEATAPAAAEVAHEGAQRVGQVEVVEADPAHAARHAGRRGLVAEAVVARAALGILEHLVGLGRLLELRLGRGVARVAIRMVLQGELPIGRLDGVLVGPALDAQHLVVVALGGHVSPLPAWRRTGSSRPAPARRAAGGRRSSSRAR